MGRLTPTSPDLAHPNKVEVTLAALNADTGPATGFQGPFRFTVSGNFVGTAAVELSMDGGTTWVPVGADAYGTGLAFTAPISVSLNEDEAGVLYRARMSAYTSGSALCRFSR